MFTGMPTQSTVRTILCVIIHSAVLFAVLHSRAGWAQQACDPSNRGMEQMEIANISLLNERRQPVELKSFIADDDLERASGYQYICPEVIARTAILFRYAAPTAGRFHMYNVKAPLDIGFFDEGGVLIQSMVMRPYEGEEILYGPMRKFQYALEARLGFFKENGLSAGSSRLLLETLP